MNQANVSRTRLDDENEVGEVMPAHSETDWRTLVEHRLGNAEGRIEELTVGQVKAQRDIAKLAPQASAERKPAEPPLSDPRPRGARWEWPLDALLLEDSEWWAAWLPRLYELLGQGS